MIATAITKSMSDLTSQKAAQAVAGWQDVMGYKRTT
jgi:hypothetical protein